MVRLIWAYVGNTEYASISSGAFEGNFSSSTHNQIF